MSSVERAKKILAHIIGNDLPNIEQDPLITEECKNLESSPPVKVSKIPVICCLTV
jgi:hypothetical protein